MFSFRIQEILYHNLLAFYYLFYYKLTKWEVVAEQTRTCCLKSVKHTSENVNAFQVPVHSFPAMLHSAYLFSISWSLLCAASISMLELSVAGRDGEEEGRGVRLWGAGQGCGGVWVASWVHKGGQLFGAGHSGLLEMCEMSNSVSAVNLLLLARHPLRRKEKCIGGKKIEQTVW